MVNFEAAPTIEAFMRADKPAGSRVCVAAAFLAGLKHGILDTPWRKKQRMISLLSQISDGLTSGKSPLTEVLRQVFRLTREVSDDTVTYKVDTKIGHIGSWREPISTMTTDESSVPIMISSEENHSNSLQAVINAPERESIGVMSTSPLASVPDSLDCSPSTPDWSDRSGSLLLNGRQPVAVAYKLSAAGHEFIQLHYYPIDGENPRKQKDLSDHCRLGGIFWRPVIDGAGILSLCYETVELPSENAQSVLADKLEEARKACFEIKVPKKRGRKSKNDLEKELFNDKKSI